MIENSIEYPSKFSHSVARDLVGFLRTINLGTQVFAVDANAPDVQTSSDSTEYACINGVSFLMPKDDGLDVSADLQLTIWATGSSYTTYHMRYIVDPSSGNKRYFKCIVAHTSAAANKPDMNDLRADALWRTYWVESTQTAEAATGDYIPNLSSRYYLCLATADGVLTLVKAGPIALDAAVKLVIPNFEPEMFVAIGHLLIDSAGFTLGTTSTAGVSTFTQISGPCFPTGAGIDQNYFQTRGVLNCTPLSSFIKESPHGSNIFTNFTEYK